VKVVLSKPVRQPRLRDRRLLRCLLREAARLTGVAEALGSGPAAELHVVLVSGRTIARLNAQFLGHRGRTDVLAFGLGGEASAAGPAVVGEIYVCPAVAAAAAVRFGTSLSHECVLYAVHGMLHLAGFDDAEPAARRAMRRAERRVLRALREIAEFGAIFADAPAVSGTAEA